MPASSAIGRARGNPPSSPTSAPAPWWRRGPTSSWRRTGRASARWRCTSRGGRAAMARAVEQGRLQCSRECAAIRTRRSLHRHVRRCERSFARPDQSQRPAFGRGQCPLPDARPDGIDDAYAFGRANAASISRRMRTARSFGSNSTSAHFSRSPSAMSRLSLTFCARPSGKIALLERSVGRRLLAPDAEAALAVQHLALLQVALGGGGDVGAEARRRAGRLVAQRRARDRDAELEPDHVDRPVQRGVAAATCPAAWRIPEKQRRA